MTISQVRTYFDGIINSVDSSIKKWDKFFDRDNIPRNLQAKAYHLSYGNLASQELADLSTDDDLTVVIELYFKQKRDHQSTFDTAMDTAHSIRMEAIKPQNAMVGANIKNVILNSMVPEVLDNSDSSVIVTLEFTVRLLFNH